MSRVEAGLHRITDDLRHLQRHWVLVGGLAVSARTEPRFTRDADLAVAVTDDRDAEMLVLALQQRGYRVIAAVEQEATRRLATVRLIPPGEAEDGVVLDLLLASSGIEAEVVAAAEPLEILPGLRVPVAQIGHLIALKILSRDDRARPQDRVDLAALLARADSSALELAREGLAAIVARSYARGRDLLADLDVLLAN